MKPITHILLAGMLLFANTLFGQMTTTLNPATANVPIGQSVALQVRVTGFSNVISLQFPIKFDKTVLQFDSISMSVLPGFNAGSYTPPATANTLSRVVVSWFADQAQFPNGFTLSDNTSLFTLHFKAIGNGVSNVNLANFTSPPLQVEVLKTGGQNVTVSFQNGSSNVTAGTGTPPPPPLQGFKVIANTIFIPQGGTGCMPVTVNDFDNIVSMQYAMHWDPLVLDYTTTQGHNLPSLSASSSFSEPATPTGTLLLQWEDPTTLGVTRADGAKIYDVCFTAVGAVGARSIITFDGVGFPLSAGGAEAVNANGSNVWTNNPGISDTIFVITAPPPPNPVTFTADRDTVPMGQQTCVAVKVTNFTDVISTQFGITYDATKIQYQSIQLSPNPLGLSAGANFNPGVSGEIRFFWDNPTSTGLDLPDNTTIFSICFTGVGPVNSQSAFTFAGFSGLPVEIVKDPGGPTTPVLNHGLVFIKQADVPVATLAAQNVKCPNGNDGSITLNLTGCSGATYNWAGPGINNNNKTVQSPTGLIAGTYTVTVTCSGGATTTATATLTAPPAFALSQQITNLTCAGTTTGAINATVTGGTTPYATYMWTGPNGFTAATEDISTLGSGLYTLKVTDANSCSNTFSALQVSGPPPIMLSTGTVTNVKCLGQTNGGVVLNVTGGTPGSGNSYTYSWFNTSTNMLASTAKNPDNLGCGTYNVTVTDANSCTAKLNTAVTINCPPAAFTVNTPQIVNPTCPGANGGSIDLTWTGGWPGTPSVTWSPSLPGGASPDNVPAGNYTATVTDPGGCSATVTAAVTAPPAITFSTPPTVQHVSCFGLANGSISVNPTGGNGAPYTVLWNGTQTGNPISNLPGGTYMPVVTDNQGCTAALASVTVNIPAEINITETVVQPAIGVPGSISVTLAGGTGTLGAVWSGPGVNGNTNLSLTGLQQGGNYTITVTDGNDCTRSETYTIIPSDVFFGITFTTTGSCGSNGCLQLNIPATATPPFTVSWTGFPNIPNGSQIGNTLALDVCGLKPGNYTFTITDGNGQTTTLNTVQIIQLDAALAGSNVVNPNDGFNNGSICLTPVNNAPLTYSWNYNNATTNCINGLDAGTYTVTITHSVSGCTSVIPFTLNYPPLTISSANTNPGCVNTLNGGVALTLTGGDLPFTYAWTGPNNFTATTQNLNNVAPGQYNLTVTQANGNTSTFSTTLTPQSALAITNVNELSNYGGFQVSGANTCDGVANVVFSGQVGNTSILWSNGIAVANNSTLCAGAYSVTVTDGLGCTSVWTDALTAPAGIAAAAQPVSDFNGFNVSCNGECDGVARVQVSGGILPYTVQWPSGQSDQLPSAALFSQAVNLCGGAYTVTVTDGNGVTSLVTVEVTQPDPITADFASVEPTSFTACDGELLIQPNGTVGEVDFLRWYSAIHVGTGQRAEGLCAGELVFFEFIDENGCTGIFSDTIPYPPDGCMQVRPVITPEDQDGNNDFLFISCIESVPNNSIEIYNRYGQLVYNADSYNNGTTAWTGTNANGEPLPEGVYFYVLNFVDADGNQRQLKGHINLLR